MSEIDGVFEPDYEGVERDIAAKAQDLRILALEDANAKMRSLVADLYECVSHYNNCDNCRLNPCGLCHEPTFSMRMFEMGIEVGE